MIRDILGHSPQSKKKVLYLTSLTTKKEAQHLVGLFGFCRQHELLLGIFLWPVYQVAWKAACIEWRQSRKRIYSRSWIRYKQFCYLDHTT
jgi:hypothetical protein